MATRRLALCALMVLTIGSTAEGKTYFAERYNSRIEVLHGGTLRVTETVTLRFDAGPFTQFYRMVPTRSTDGIEIVSTSMDGQILPAGEGPGHVQISGSSRVRVTWRFPPASNASHTFELTYLVRGTVRQEDNADVVGWRILPTEHAYRINGTTAEIVLPLAPAAAPSIQARRVADSTVAVSGQRVIVEASDIRANGWIEAWVRLPRGSIVDGPPQWQQRQEGARRLAGVWALTAGIVFVCGMALLLGIRQRYDPPPADLTPSTSWSAPPDTLSPALAGMLLTNGRASLEHAMAEVFSLADRSELRIEELPRTLGQRNFTITRIPTGHALSPLEERVLDIIFTGRHGVDRSVSLGKARTRLMRQFRRFREVLNPAMQEAGLLDEDRQTVRRRFLRAGIATLISAAILLLLFALLAQRYDGWPMLMSLALVGVGVVALIAHAAHTPLSNEGVRRSNQWRGFQRYLRAVARDREASPGADATRQLLPFAVALGIAPAWSSYLKRHRLSAPPWFRATADSSANSGAAFAAFVASGGTGASGHAHGVSGGAAAGGGASGAS